MAEGMVLLEIPNEFAWVFIIEGTNVDSILPSEFLPVHFRNPCIPILEHAHHAGAVKCRVPEMLDHCKEDMHRPQERSWLVM